MKKVSKEGVSLSSSREGTPRAAIRVGDEGDAPKLAYERVLPAAMGLPKERVMRVTIDVAAAIPRARTALGRLRAMQQRIDDELPKVSAAQLDAFDDVSNALTHAHVEYTLGSPASPDAPDLVALTAECVELRALGRDDLASLVRRGVLTAERVEGIKNGPSREELVIDLFAIDRCVTEARAIDPARVVMTLAEQENLRARALALRDALEFGGERAKAHIEVRARIYTLFVEQYDGLRKVMTWLRWEEGDADELAPSLFVKANRGEKAKAEGDDGEGDGGGAAGGGAAGGVVKRGEPAVIGREAGVRYEVPQDDPFVKE